MSYDGKKHLLPITNQADKKYYLRDIHQINEPAIPSIGRHEPELKVRALYLSHQWPGAPRIGITIAYTNANAFDADFPILTYALTKLNEKYLNRKDATSSAIEWWVRREKDIRDTFNYGEALGLSGATLNSLVWDSVGPHTENYQTAHSVLPNFES
jgi:hypothetical protein